MAKQTTQNDLLDEIESNIDATERRIYRLKIEFASLMAHGQTLKRRLILQQRYIRNKT
jgi:hypothetical protein